jgi:hypothetical protein
MIGNRSLIAVIARRQIDAQLKLYSILSSAFVKPSKSLGDSPRARVYVQVPQSLENYFRSEKDATVTAMNSITDSRITYTPPQAIANSPPTPIAGSEQSGSNTTPAVAQTTASGPSISSNAASAIATLNGILGQQPIATKSFSEVTTDARATLNANYASMKAAGTPINYDTATQKDLDSAFKGLDRRSLFAIASVYSDKLTGK